MKNVVGPRIREARYRRGQKVSQEELAARLQAMGVSIEQTALSSIENRERQVTDIEIIAICRALGADIAEVFFQAELPPPSGR